MKKFTQITKLFSAAAISLLASGIIMLAPLKASALTIPYQGDTTPNAPSPMFNVYTGVPSEGNEQDFLRGKVTGDPAPSTNAVNTACEDGTRFTLRVYVHNGASDNHNDGGNGPSVAHGTTVKVGNVTNVTGSNFAPNATISSTNPVNSISDGMTITCSNGAQVTMNYVKGTAQQFTAPGGTQPLSDSIVTTGAPIGTVKPDGNVWGCWDQRVYVTLIVEVKKVPQPPISKGECKVLNITPLGGRKIKADLTGVTENAQIIGYEINWGDNTTSANATGEHTYAQDGTYTIVGRVNVKYADGRTEWKTATDCAKQVTFKPDTPVVPVTPVTPTTPTTLVATGPGDIAAIFAAISIAGGVAYRVYLSRRLNA